MPRIAAVFGRSITWFSRVNPSPLTTLLCFIGEQIADRTYFDLDLAAAADFDVLVVISIPWSLAL